MLNILQSVAGRFFSWSAISPLSSDVDDLEKLVRFIHEIAEPIFDLLGSEDHPAVKFMASAATGLGAILFPKLLLFWVEGKFFTEGLFSRVEVQPNEFIWTLNFGKVFQSLSAPLFHLGSFLYGLDFLQSAGMISFAPISKAIGEINFLSFLNTWGLEGFVNRLVVAASILCFLGVFEFLYVKGGVENLSERERVELLVQFVNSLAKAYVVYGAIQRSQGISFSKMGIAGMGFLLSASNMLKIMLKDQQRDFKRSEERRKFERSTSPLSRDKSVLMQKIYI